MTTDHPHRSLNNSSPVQPLRTRAARTARRGFTLLEMVLVAVLIAALATIVVVNVAGKSDKARERFTVTRIAQIKSALTEYNTDYGTYPSDLQTLVSAGKGYLDKVPLDDFKRAIVYQYPGSAGDTKKPYDLYSTGKDGVFGTPDDIEVWTMDEKAP
jgi:general secretion pathway protein G